MTVAEDLEINKKLELFVEEVRDIPEDLIDDVLISLASMVDIDVGSAAYMNIKEMIYDIRFT